MTDAVLYDLPEPTEDERIARVVSTRGGNQFEVCVAGESSSNLAILPTKFHKLVWVKRGDYVLVEVGQDGKEDESKTSVDGGIRHMITHILYKDQISHLRSKSLWPDDPEFAAGEATEARDLEEECNDDGIIFQEPDEDIFVNTNRIAKLEINESSGDESSNSE